MSHRRSAFLVLALVGSLSLTGCSDDAPKLTAKQRAAVKVANAFAGQPAPQLVAAAKTALEGVSSVHFVTDGQSSGAHVVVDVAVDSGGNCVGTVTQGTAVAQVRGVDGTYWTQPDVAYIKRFLAPGDAGAVDRLRGKWIVSPTVSATCDLRSVLDAVTTGISGGTQTRGKRSEIRGQDTIGVKVASGDRTTTAAIRTSTPHYVVSYGLAGSGGDTGTVDLSGFDAPVQVKAPPADLVVQSAG